MITLVFGPMFSGKTTYLLAWERRFLIAKKRVLIVKWEGDRRYSDTQVLTHDGQANQGKVINAERLSEIDRDLIDNVDAVLIDEGQFFPDLGEWCRAHNDKTIVIAGLSGDYKQEPFRSIVDVMSLCDNIVHIKSICSKCGADAAFTVRLSEEKEQTVVGSSDKYQPRCGKCLN
jgi:thymidine kinase